MQLFFAQTQTTPTEVIHHGDPQSGWHLIYDAQGKHLIIKNIHPLPGAHYLHHKESIHLPFLSQPMIHQQHIPIDQRGYNYLMGMIFAQT